MLQAFLSSLEERQKDCRLYIDRIGDIILEHMPNMGVYLVSRPEGRCQIRLLTVTTGVLRQSEYSQ